MAEASRKTHPSELRATPTVSIAEAKAKFASLVDRVEKKHTSITILRRGVPVAQIVPLPDAAVPRLSGSMAGTGRELGDIIGPTGEEWTVDGDWTLDIDRTADVE